MTDGAAPPTHTGVLVPVGTGGTGGTGGCPTCPSIAFTPQSPPAEPGSQTQIPGAASLARKGGCCPLVAWELFAGS